MGHNLVLLTRLKDPQQRLAYAQSAIANGWSRNVLNIHIETRLLERSGTAVTNFDVSLPKAQSDLARESLKDPYRFDFLGLRDEAQEREIEHALVKHVTEFLLELGAGFAFVGRQVLLDVGGDEFFIDLLFYHLKLRCYVVIELKAGKFKPEHLGQLGFYMTAVDRQVKGEHDNPTIGLCSARAKIRSWPNMRWAIRPSPWASPSTNCSNLCLQNCKPACPALNRSNVNWRATAPSWRTNHSDEHYQPNQQLHSAVGIHCYSAHWGIQQGQ